MKDIFDEISIGNLKMKNRIVRSATQERGGAIDGILSPLYKEIYTDLADGEIGLIITGMLGIGENSCNISSMGKTYSNDFHEKFSEITKIVHDKGGEIVAQISHCGAFATVLESRDTPLAPSDYDKNGSKAATKEQIDLVVKDFGKAAKACKDAGADGVQLHVAHGYLLSQFLTPAFNKRDDEYGGSIENRAKIVFESYDEIRKQVGDDYPVLIKINSFEDTPGGLQLEDSILVCKELEKRGLSAVEFSGGNPIKLVKDESEEGYFCENAKLLAKNIQIPVISVGGFRTPSSINKALNATNIAGVSLARPLIREPKLVKTWKSGNLKKADCISCSRCLRAEKYSCPVLIELQAKN